MDNKEIFILRDINNICINGIDIPSPNYYKVYSIDDKLYLEINVEFLTVKSYELVIQFLKGYISMEDITYDIIIDTNITSPGESEKRYMKTKYKCKIINSTFIKVDSKIHNNLPLFEIIDVDYLGIYRRIKNI